MQGDDGFEVVSRHDLLNAAASIYGCARTLLDASERLPDGTKAELLQVIIRQSEWLGQAMAPREAWSSP